MTVFFVYPDNIPRIWPEVLPLLEKAIRRHGTHDGDDVLAALMDGRAQLWIQRGTTTEAAAVTEISVYPKLRACRIWLAGGGGRGNWRAFHDAIAAWARERACKELTIAGRHGWLRLFPKARATGITMRMTI